MAALDAGGEDLRKTTYQRNGVTVPRPFYLISAARKMNPAMQKIPEGNTFHLQLKSLRDE